MSQVPGPTKPTNKQASSRKPKTKPLQPDHNEIAQRAYFIYLEQGSFDELANWLRAERELAAGDIPLVYLRRRCLVSRSP